MDREHRKALEVIEHQRIEIADLKYRLSELARRLYGSTSEKGDPNQLKLLELEEGKKHPEGISPEAAEDDDAAAAEPSKRKRRKQERLRKSMKDLLTTIEVIEPEEVQKAPHLWKLIGEEVSEELHFEPSRCLRHQIIRRKYARREELEEGAGKNVTIAALPPRLLEGSVLTSSLLAGLIISKYCWHQPLHRQEQMLRAAGVECSRSLMCHWLEIGADFIEPLHRLQRTKLLASDYLQADETPIDYLSPGNGRTKKGYLWVLHNPAIGIYYQWQTGRGHQHLLDLIGNKDDFTGILQHDAYQPYLTLAKERGLGQVSCMAHIRRGFDKALEQSPALAGWFLRHFARLYHIEAELRKNKHSSEQRSRRRRRHSRPILDLLKKATQHLLQKSSILPKSPLGKALRYALGQLPLMENWIKNGQVEIDNNLIENAIRPTKLGAKNWMFIGSARSGKKSAILYTLVENVRRLNRDPFEYLKWVFEKIRLNPTLKNWEPLLPVNWVALHPEGRTIRKAA